jgi:hypothetical protein
VQRVGGRHLTAGECSLAAVRHPAGSQIGPAAKAYYVILRPAMLHVMLMLLACHNTLSKPHREPEGASHTAGPHARPKLPRVGCPRASSQKPVADLVEGLNFSKFDLPSGNPHMRYTLNGYEALVGIVEHAARVGKQMGGAGTSVLDIGGSSSKSYEKAIRHLDGINYTSLDFVSKATWRGSRNEVVISLAYLVPPQNLPPHFKLPELLIPTSSARRWSVSSATSKSATRTFHRAVFTL